MGKCKNCYCLNEAGFGLQSGIANAALIFTSQEVFCIRGTKLTVDAGILMNQIMNNIIDQIDWSVVTNEMHAKGFAIIPNFLTDKECEIVKADYHNRDAYRKTVVKERYRFGLGDYKYFNYPLPATIHQIRTSIYPQLAPIANAWFSVLNVGKQFPLRHAELLQQCRENNQQKATVLILRYGKGGHNTLHQDLYGDIYLPIQTVLF